MYSALEYAKCSGGGDNDADVFLYHAYAYRVVQFIHKGVPIEEAGATVNTNASSTFTLL